MGKLRTAVTVATATLAFGCGSGGEAQTDWSEAYSGMVERAIEDGRPIAGDEDMPCDPNQLRGRYALGRVLSESSFTVIDTETGEPPQLEQVTCYKAPDLGATVILATLGPRD